MLNLHSLSFACPIVRYPTGLPAALVESGRVRLPDDRDTGDNEWLLGQPCFGEAFATEAARDARLGPVHTHIAFVRTTWAQVEDSGASLADIAIGPALGEEGFAKIADLVIPAKVEKLLKFALCSGSSEVSVIIGRVSYTVRRDETSALSIMVSPLYRAWNSEPEIDATIEWLHQVFAKQLSILPTPPTPARSLLSDPCRPA